MQARPPTVGRWPRPVLYRVVDAAQQHLQLALPPALLLARMFGATTRIMPHGRGVQRWLAHLHVGAMLERPLVVLSRVPRPLPCTALRSIHRMHRSVVLRVRLRLLGVGMLVVRMLARGLLMLRLMLAMVGLRMQAALPARIV